MGLDEDFHAAAEEAKHLPNACSNDDKLELYALYKQATHGDCDTDKPGLLDFTGKAKWEAWNKLKGTKTQDEAKTAYIELVAALKVKYAGK